MSLREIRSHTKQEIDVMLEALSRFRVIKEGYGMTPAERSDTRNMKIWNAYLDETEKYKICKKKYRLKDED